MHPSDILLALPLVLASCSTEHRRDPVQSDDPAVQLAQYPGAPYEGRDGDLWFSTVMEGLIRYDGSEFVTHTTEDGLASDTVRDLLEDDDGVLWIATTGGVSTYDGESFVTLADHGDTPLTYSFTAEGDHRDVWDILQDRRGDFWFGTSCGGVHRYDGEAFRYFSSAEGLGGGGVPSISEDRNGTVWLGTTSGVFRFDGERFHHFTKQDPRTSG